MLWISFAVATGVALIILISLVFYIIGLQRRLVSQDEVCMNALSQIGVQMNSRWDGLIALAETMKGYARHEHETLVNVINQRKHCTLPSDASEINRQEGMLSAALGKLMAISEAYPELKADGLYATTMSSITEAENKVRMSRMVYNDSVTIMNRTVRMFPASLFAGMLGFRVRPYLEEPAGKTNMPSMA